MELWCFFLVFSTWGFVFPDHVSGRTCTHTHTLLYSVFLGLSNWGFVFMLFFPFIWIGFLIILLVFIFLLFMYNYAICLLKICTHTQLFVYCQVVCGFFFFMNWVLDFLGWVFCMFLFCVDVLFRWSGYGWVEWIWG